MNSSPKILVFKLRSLIYTLLLLFFGILLIVCLVLMFSPKQKRDGQVLPDTARSMTPESQTQSTASTDPDPANTNRTEKNTGVSIRNSRYIPGVYTASVPLGDSAADVEVTLNANRIQAIRLVNLSEATAAAFPLVSPSFENISSQILAKQSTDEVIRIISVQIHRPPILPRKKHPGQSISLCRNVFLSGISIVCFRSEPLSCSHSFYFSLMPEIK